MPLGQNNHNRKESTDLNIYDNALYDSNRPFIDGVVQDDFVDSRNQHLKYNETVP